MAWQTYNTKDIKGKYLFKFLSEKNLIKFLQTGNIWFSRSDKFGDKMECVMIKDLMKSKPDFDSIEKRKKRNLISCFHEGNKETLAFLDTYAKTDEERRKYALRFDRLDFIKAVESNTSTIKPSEGVSILVHGKVKYKNLIGTSKSNLESKSVKYPAFRKESVFAYEREYRFVIMLKSETALLGYDLNLGKPSDISFSIFVNPLLENAEYIKCLKKIE